MQSKGLGSSLGTRPWSGSETTWEEAGNGANYTHIAMHGFIKSSDRFAERIASSAAIVLNKQGTSVCGRLMFVVMYWYTV